jgi:hypothetical protein
LYLSKISWEAKACTWLCSSCAQERAQVGPSWGMSAGSDRVMLCSFQTKSLCTLYRIRNPPCDEKRKWTRRVCHLSWKGPGMSSSQSPSATNNQIVNRPCSCLTKSLKVRIVRLNHYVLAAKVRNILSFSNTFCLKTRLNCYIYCIWCSLFILLREYMTLHTTYPLHLTTLRTYTLKLPHGITQRSHDPGIT